MTWLYVPSGRSRSAPGSAVSTSVSSKLSLRTGLWVTSSETPTLRPSSWRGWRTRPWIGLLSGTTSRPSRVADGVRRWIASWQASPVSRGRRPASAGGRPTLGGSGRRSQLSFATYDRSGAFWRTSQVSLVGGGFSRFSGPWPRSGSMRSGRAFERPTAGRPTNGSVFSSWATPTVGDHQRALDTRASPGHTRKNGVPNLAYRAEVLWYTPTGRDWKDGDPTANVPTRRLLGRQAPRSEVGGDPCSSTDPTSRRRLNPAFVEWLMGFPIGWTAFEPLATRSSHLRQPTPSARSSGG